MTMAECVEAICEAWFAGWRYEGWPIREELHQAARG